MLFDTIEPVSARQRDPRLGKGNLFFTATGKATTFGKVANIAAHALGGPMLGSLAQQGLNKLAMNGLTGADTIQNARTSADKMIATGQMVDQAVMPILQTATNLFVPGAGAALSAATGAAQSITKPQQPVNAIPSVIPDPVGSEGAVNFTGDTSAGQLWQSPSLSITNPYKKPVYSFASGGFARKFAEERAKQGAGGVFTYQGKQYNTFYKEELQPDPSREMTPFPTPGVTGVNMGQIKQKIASVESGGNYNAVNPSTGALGKYQFLKSTLKDYGVNPDEFLRNPALQETVMDRHLKNQLPTAMSLMNRYGDQRDWGVGDFLAGIHLKGRTGLTRELATGRTNRPSRLNPSTDEYVSRTRMYFDGGITLYPKDDKESEDLLMTDEKTGEFYGRMRKGEYILPQLMSLASGTIMDSDAPQAQKERALGRMLFGQLSRKPVDVAQFRFADGGGTMSDKEYYAMLEKKWQEALLRRMQAKKELDIWEENQKTIKDKISEGEYKLTLGDAANRVGAQEEFRKNLREADSDVKRIKSQLQEVSARTGIGLSRPKTTKPSSSQTTIGTTNIARGIWSSRDSAAKINRNGDNQISITTPASTGIVSNTNNIAKGKVGTSRPTQADVTGPIVTSPSSVGATVNTNIRNKGVVSSVDNNFIDNNRNTDGPLVTSPGSSRNIVNNLTAPRKEPAFIGVNTKVNGGPVITGPSSFGLVTTSSPNAVQADTATYNLAQRRADRRERLGYNVTNPDATKMLSPKLSNTATGRIGASVKASGTTAKPTVTSPAQTSQTSMSVNPLIPRAQSTDKFAQSTLSTDLSGKVNTVIPVTSPSSIGSSSSLASGTATGSGFNLSRLSGDLMDAGKLAFGASIASRPIESPSIPPIWTNYMGELANRKNQGLTPEEMALAGNNMVNNYRQGVSALSQVAGGGASPGTVLTGLSNLGLQRGNQSQSLLAMDAAARNTNFARYGAGVGQTAAMEQGIQADRINRQTQDRAVGLGLVQNALTGIQERDTYYQNQPLYDKYMQSLVDRENEAAQTLKAMRTNYAAGIR